MNRALTLLAFMFIVFSSFAQHRLSGHVYDGGEDDRKPLPGVTVYIEGTSLGTISDFDGKYSILLPHDSAVLKFSFIGYEDKVVKVGDRSTIDIVMLIDAKNLSEVTVTAQAKGQKNAILKQVNSNTIKNVVASDRLQENPDANAAEAIGRLPGVSLMRGGGEGQGIVIRGLSPSYSKVTLNGIEMPSTADDRSTNISGVSQYMLQGVEVFKALTSDMEADAVAGTINLSLREAPQGFKSSFMAQMGYNNMNQYWGNYKLAGDISQRFFDDKLGVSLSLSAERVMRSTQTMSAAYSSGTSTNDINILINGISLNLVDNIKYRKSAMLALDYRVFPSTIINFYSLYNNSNSDYSRQTKNYGTTGSGNIGYSFAYNPFAKDYIWQNTLSAKTTLNNIEIDYGFAYSFTRADDPNSRSWNFTFNSLPNSIAFTEEMRKKDPSEIIPLYNDDLSDETLIENVRVASLGSSSSALEDQNMTSYFDVKIPFRFGKLIEGYLKTGGRYRNKHHIKDVTGGSQLLIANQFAGPALQERLDWLHLAPNNQIEALGMTGGNTNSFFNGQYDFGTTFSFDRLNELYDAWDATSQYWKDYANANGGWGATLPDGSSMPSIEKAENVHNIAHSILNDQNIREEYYASYLMAEVKFGKWGLLMPGIRYEKTKATMDGFIANEPTLSPPVSKEILGKDTTRYRGDDFFLPNLHLRLSPFRSFYIHGAYTKTLRRPNFDDITPNIYTAVRLNPPHTYITKAPLLKAERWTNYDLQFTYHSKKVGLISWSGFYKTVSDKMWTRTWTRLPGDELVGFFGDADQVSITQPQNHTYPIYLKGFEFEVQTSFWYLPQPFNYFTTSFNYTYTDSETQYPVSWTQVETVFPPGGGRPKAYTTRVDTTIAGRMTHSPKHIVNASLGYNKGGLNIWLSYQYNGDILTSKTLNQSAVLQNGEMDGLKESFQRWDLQVSYKFKGRLEGFEVLGNFANLNDYMENGHLRGDSRPLFLENYGWTIDFGLRYHL